ncbi:MAG TPA: PASTA domain-containing protein [Elusimicrobiota bacterium]|nr:PASTA domain-containing protein [Elusimicrobiota bacterium]
MENNENKNLNDHLVAGARKVVTSRVFRTFIHLTEVFMKGLIHWLKKFPGLSVFLLIFFTITLAYWAMEPLIHQKGLLVVPDLVGKSVDQALDLLAPMDLSLAKASVEFNESFPAGAVLRQVPPSGMSVREGKVIRVTISSGGQVVFVPDMKNKPLTEAQNILKHQGLVLGTISEAYSQLHEVNFVMEQTPEANAVVKRGHMVDLRVSKGAPPEGTLLIPNFANQALRQATEWADSHNIKKEIKEELNNDMLPDMIIRQEPLPDTLVTEETVLRFVVSRSTYTSKGESKVIRYQVPEGSGRVQVRISVRDMGGERDVFQGYQEAGSVVDVPIRVRGASRSRIFVNSVLIEERPIEE